MNISSQKRRLWEFKGPIICRLLGLTFDEQQLNKVLKKLRTKGGQPPLTLSEEHGVLVETCAKQNELSKYMEKVLERQFEPYRKWVEGIDQKDICRFIEGEREINGLKSVPLPALIWFAVRNQHEEIDEIEARIFCTIHDKEHQALRFYDALSRELPDGKAENVLRELKQTLRSKEELERRYKRSEQKRKQLKLEMEAIKKDKSQVTLALAEQRKLNARSKKSLEKLGGQSALEQIESLKKDVDILNQEIRTLTQELLNQGLYGAVDITNESIAYHGDEVEPKPVATSDLDGEQNGQLSLEGIKVAFVGGLKSLAPHYQQMVERLGGIFCHYCEECRGRREAENVVGSADIVFCPIDMNSHGCCRCIKRACKSTGKPCCFLRSSSLSTFGKELVDFALDLS